jgi:hypothetical protein
MRRSKTGLELKVSGCYQISPIQMHDIPMHFCATVTSARRATMETIATERILNERRQRNVEISNRKGQTMTLRMFDIFQAKMILRYVLFSYSRGNPLCRNQGIKRLHFSKVDKGQY